MEGRNVNEREKGERMMGRVREQANGRERKNETKENNGLIIIPAISLIE